MTATDVAVGRSAGAAETAAALAADDRRQGRLRRIRRLTIIAGLFLAAVFFMPMASSCSSTISPAEFVADGAQEISRSIADDPAGLIVDWTDDPWGYHLMIWCTMPHIFGVLCVVAVIRRQRGTAPLPGMATSLMRWLLVFEAGLVLLGVWAEGPYGPDSFFVWWLLLSRLWGLLLLLRAARLNAVAPLVTTLVGTVWFAGWFAMFARGADALEVYGPFVGLAACASLGLLAVAELAALTGNRGRAVLWRLLTLRPDLPQRVITECVHCGYSLRGLTEPRCPECGTPFQLPAPSATPPA